jgi:hypothetical protein
VKALVVIEADISQLFIVELYFDIVDININEIFGFSNVSEILLT